MTWPQPQPPPVGGSSSSPAVSPGRIVVIASGVLLLLASFLAWLEFGGESVSAWTTDFGLFPLSVMPALIGLLSAVAAGLQLLGPSALPHRVWEFTWEQLHLVLALFALLIVLGYLVMEKSALDFGLGYFGTLLGALGLAVGAVLMVIESMKPSGPPPGFGQPTFPPPPQQQQPPPGSTTF